jgi:hypothetical protein
VILQKLASSYLKLGYLRRKTFLVKPGTLVNYRILKAVPEVGSIEGKPRTFRLPMEAMISQTCSILGEASSHAKDVRIPSPINVSSA